jgi:hypothetical protein
MALTIVRFICVIVVASALLSFAVAIDTIKISSRHFVNAKTGEKAWQFQLVANSKFWIKGVDVSVHIS